MRALAGPAGRIKKFLRSGARRDLFTSGLFTQLRNLFCQPF
jgi:hypothetical protein